MKIAVTGHRPERLGGFNVETMERLSVLAVQSLGTFPNIQHVYTGMALGWDQAIALACITMGIPFIAVPPNMNQSAKWSFDMQVAYRTLMAKASLVVCLKEWSDLNFNSACLMRNKAMVDRADHILALWDGTPTGGTAYTIRHAHGMKKPITNTWNKWLELESENIH